MAYIPSLIVLVLLFLITRQVLKILRAFFDALGSGHLKPRSFEREWVLPIYRIFAC